MHERVPDESVGAEGAKDRLVVEWPARRVLVREHGQQAKAKDDRPGSHQPANKSRVGNKKDGLSPEVKNKK